MNKLEEYVLRYQGIHSGTDQYLALDGKLYDNITDPTKGKVLFDGSQLGKKFPNYIQQVINNKGRAITLLDYGCGKAIHTHRPLSAHGNKTLLGRFNGMLQCYYCYDPAVVEYSVKPPKGMQFDLTCCADVMEHVPEEFVPSVLSEINDYTKEDGVILFSISGNLAKKRFKDGENLHATLKSLEWWANAIMEYCKGKSFILIHDDQKRMSAPETEEEKKQLEILKQKHYQQNTGTPFTYCSTWINYHNSSLYNHWTKQIVDECYYENVNVEEVK